MNRNVSFIFSNPNNKKNVWIKILEFALANKINNIRVICTEKVKSLLEANEIKFSLEKGALLNFAVFALNETSCNMLANCENLGELQIFIFGPNNEQINFYTGNYPLSIKNLTKKDFESLIENLKKFKLHKKIINGEIFFYDKKILSINVAFAISNDTLRQNVWKKILDFARSKKINAVAIKCAKVIQDEIEDEFKKKKIKFKTKIEQNNALINSQRLNKKITELLTEWSNFRPLNTQFTISGNKNEEINSYDCLSIAISNLEQKNFEELIKKLKTFKLHKSRINGELFYSDKKKLHRK